MHTPKWSGVFTAIVTPFNTDMTLDFASLERLIEQQIAAGIDGIVVSGCNGEGTVLDMDERLLLLQRAVEIAKGRCKVIAGPGANGTRQAVAFQRAVQEIAIDATLHLCPWVNKPTQEGLYQHFKAVADAASVPVILYNNPARTCSNIEAATLVRLANDCSQIVAIKDCNTSLPRQQLILEGLQQVRSDFAVLSGEDDAVLALYGLGAHGVVGTISNFAPLEMVQMHRSFFSGDIKTARALSWRLNHLSQLVFFRPNPIPLKMALAAKGLIQANFRLPLMPLNGEDNNFLLSELKKQGWL